MVRRCKLVAESRYNISISSKQQQVRGLTKEKMEGAGRREICLELVVDSTTKMMGFRSNYSSRARFGS